MHDWNDDYCVQILIHLRQAMAPDSILLLDVIVMPETHATTTACLLDISMLEHSSWERSETQWRQVLAEAGFTLEMKYCYDTATGSFDFRDSDTCVVRNRKLG